MISGGSHLPAGAGIINHPAVVDAVFGVPNEDFARGKGSCSPPPCPPTPAAVPARRRRSRSGGRRRARGHRLPRGSRHTMASSTSASSRTSTGRVTSPGSSRATPPSGVDDHHADLGHLLDRVGRARRCYRCREGRRIAEATRRHLVHEDAAVVEGLEGLEGLPMSEVKIAACRPYGLAGRSASSRSS